MAHPAQIYFETPEQQKKYRENVKAKQWKNFSQFHRALAENPNLVPHNPLYPQQ